MVSKTHWACGKGLRKMAFAFSVSEKVKGFYLKGESNLSLPVHEMKDTPENVRKIGSAHFDIVINNDLDYIVFDDKKIYMIVMKKKLVYMNPNFLFSLRNENDVITISPVPLAEFRISSFNDKVNFFNALRGYTL